MDKDPKPGRGQPELIIPWEAVRRCMLTCLTNGWVPKPEEVWELIRLKEQYLHGERDEFRLSDNEWNHLETIRATLRLEDLERRGRVRYPIEDAIHSWRIECAA